MVADDATNDLVGGWKKTHVGTKAAEFANTLARSPIVKLFADADLDILESIHGTICAYDTRGRIDFEELAIAELGEKRVRRIQESYRKPSTKVPQAPSAWALEAGY